MKKLITLLTVSLLFCSVCYAGVHFDDTDDYIRIGDGTVLDNATAMTISCWIKPDVNTGEQTIIAEWASTAATRKFVLNTNGDELAFIAVNESPNRYFKEETDAWNFSAGTWCHIVTVFTAPQSCVFYIDNSIEASTTYVSNDVDALNTTTTSLDIAAQNASSVYDGVITEVALWDTALSATDIEILYKSRIKGMPLQIKPANLVAYWPLDDICDGCNLAGASFLDRSSGGNTGTGSDANASGGQGRGESLLSYPRRR